MSLKAVYDRYLTGYDWGCCISKIVLHLNTVLSLETLKKMIVVETKEATDFTKVPEFPVVTIDETRKVLDVAYISDDKKDVAVTLYCSPSEGNAFTFNMHTQYNTWSPYTLSVEIDGEKVELEVGKQVTDADPMTLGKFDSSDGIHLEYASYLPTKNPETLVVWLHGLGEGGVENTDPYVTVLANRVTALIQNPFQSYLHQPAVLAPQCPTYWMDGTGDGANFMNGGIEATEKSYYTNALIELIDTYKKEIGAKKVIICGCSNGGYMTVVLALNCTTKYDAYVPICEALGDRYITADKIKEMKDLNMFFVYSQDDPIVDPILHEVPTVARLRAAGGKNIHVFAPSHVIDLSGEYQMPDGSPYTYSGHWSWIYFDNNQVTSDLTQETVFEWMAKQVL